MGVRSLFAGVSGLRNYQQQLDIIGNNISNGNTPGYKSARVTFQDLLSQTFRSATGGTAGGLGGTNPQQVGLGSTLGAIDIDTTQGNLLTTGRMTDMAIQGEGYFAVTDGDDIYYTRSGAFNIDENGSFVSTTSGYKARGYNATAGVLADIPDTINIPVGVVIEAEPTSAVEFVGNLDAGAEQVGSIHESVSTWAIELTASDNDMEGLYANGNLDNVISGLANLTSTVTVNLAGTATTYTYTSTANPTTADQFHSLAELAAEIETDYGALFTNPIAVSATGALVFDTAVADTTISVSSNNSSLNGALFLMNGGGTVGIGTSATSDEFSHRAKETDLLTNLRNSAGATLALPVGDVISINGDVGGTAVTSGSITVAAGTTLGDLCNQVATTLGITNSDNNVYIDSLGKMQIYGDGGSNYEISNIDISDGDGGTFDGIFSDASGDWAKTQSASDNHVLSYIAYDSVGTSHTITYRFNIRDEAGSSNQWVWDVESSETATGTADSIPTSTGSVTFNADGSLLAFSPSNVTIDPQGGIGANMEIILNPGTIGDTDGLVCYDSSSSTARAINANGYTAGELEAISINNTGTITGNFTNGQNQILARIAIAVFDNPEGLRREGNNVLAETLNSGSAVEGVATTGGRGTIIPAALEGSNVDLAAEFVNLITAQRGYQTNARMITVSDRMLQELVGLVR